MIPLCSHGLLWSSTWRAIIFKGVCTGQARRIVPLFLFGGIRTRWKSAPDPEFSRAKCWQCDHHIFANRKKSLLMNILDHEIHIKRFITYPLTLTSVTSFNWSGRNRRWDLDLRGIGNVEALTHQSLALPALILHADQWEGIEDWLSTIHFVTGMRAIFTSWCFPWYFYVN
jgi:hypothetical protein